MEAPAGTADSGHRGPPRGRCPRQDRAAPVPHGGPHGALLPLYLLRGGRRASRIMSCAPCPALPVRGPGELGESRGPGPLHAAAAHRPGSAWSPFPLSGALTRTGWGQACLGAWASRVVGEVSRLLAPGPVPQLAGVSARERCAVCVSRGVSCFLTDTSSAVTTQPACVSGDRRDFRQHVASSVADRPGAPGSRRQAGFGEKVRGPRACGLPRRGAVSTPEGWSWQVAGARPAQAAAPFTGGRGLEQSLCKRLESPARGSLLPPRTDTLHACPWPSGHRVSSGEGAESPSPGRLPRVLPRAPACGAWCWAHVSPARSGHSGRLASCPAVGPVAAPFPLPARCFPWLGHATLRARRLGADLVARTRSLPGQ